MTLDVPGADVANTSFKIIKAMRPSFAEMINDPYYYEAYDVMLDKIEALFRYESLTEAVRRINILLEMNASYKAEYNALVDTAITLEENFVELRGKFKY